MRSIRFAAFSLAVCLGVATAAHAQAPQQQAPPQQQEPAHPCAQDAERLCQGTPVGGGAQLACLKAHKDQLSPECKMKILKAAEKRQEKQMEQPQPQEAPPQ